MSKVTDMLKSAEENLPDEHYATLKALVEDFYRTTKYGLHWEEGHPGFERMWHLKVKVGSYVHALKPRGQTTVFPRPQVWTVESINEDGTADLVRMAGVNRYTQSWPVEDLVVVSNLEEKQLSGLVLDGEVIGGDVNDVYHSVINAENLRALEMLTFTHAGKMDAIYIDPPYNTGAKDWKYNNDYVDSSDQFKHSKFLSFMYQRLSIAKTLLNPDDSVLILTIDEKEYNRVGLLLEEIFPEARIQMVSSVINPRGTSRNNEFSRTDEYIYFVMNGRYRINSLESETVYSNIPWQNLRRSSESNTRDSRPNQFYAIYVEKDSLKIKGRSNVISIHEDEKKYISSDPSIVTVFPCRDNGLQLIWGLHPESFDERLKQGAIRSSVKKVNHSDVYVIQYIKSGPLKECLNSDTIKYDKNGSLTGKIGQSKATLPKTSWNISSHNAGLNGSTMIKSLLDDSRFSYPKSLYAVEDALRFFVKDKPDATILDFFGGSGTTAHAVMRLNLEDNGRRKAIIVSNNEVSDEEDKKFSAMGLRPGDAEWDKYGICQYVTKPRIKAAITGKTAKSGFTEDIKGNYRYNNEFPMSDGIKANARFFTLTGLDADAVEFGESLAEILPLLWLKSGSTGQMITENDACNGYAVSETYAVLFDADAQSEMLEELNNLGTVSKVKDVYVMDASDQEFVEVASKLHGKYNVERMPDKFLSVTLR